MYKHKTNAMREEFATAILYAGEKIMLWRIFSKLLQKFIKSDVL